MPSNAQYGAARALSLMPLLAGLAMDELSPEDEQIMIAISMMMELEGKSFDEAADQVASDQSRRRKEKEEAEDADAAQRFACRKTLEKERRPSPPSAEEMPSAKRQRAKEDRADAPPELLLSVLRPAAHAQRESDSAMLSLWKMDTTPLEEEAYWEETFIERGYGEAMDMREMVEINAIHIPEAGEVFFSMEALSAVDSCRMGGKSFHRIAFIEGKCLPEQLCYHSIGEFQGAQSFRDPEAITNLRHGMSRLVGDPAKALTDQQLLALLSCQLPGDRPPEDDARAIMEGSEDKTDPMLNDPVKPPKVVHFTRMRDTHRPKGHKWVTGILKKLASHYEKHVDRSALLNYTPKWFADLNRK